MTSDDLDWVRAHTDSSGAVIQTYQTDEVGVMIRNQGVSTEWLQKTGHERGEDGLIFLAARYLNAAADRRCNW